MIKNHPWRTALLTSGVVMVASFVLQLVIGVPLRTAGLLSGVSLPLLVVPFYKLASGFEDPGPIARFLLAASGNAGYRRPPSAPDDDRPGSKIR